MSTSALGLDIHRKFSKVSLQEMTSEGQIGVVERARLEHCDREAMRQWLSRVPAGTPVAIEAAFGWPWIADLLEEVGLEPHLGHPPAIKVLAKHEAKGDRCDADRLAKFQLRGILPESYLAPPEVRQQRERMRYRISLVRLHTGVKNRIHAILHRLGILHSFSDLFGKSGRAFLEKLDLPEASQAVLVGYLRLLDNLREEIAGVEQWMRRNLAQDEVVRWLKTLPGVGVILAHVIRAEIGQIERFPDYRHLGSYSGLAPLSDDSADRHGRRHCSPACNHTLRWALIEAATGVLATKGDKVWRLRRLYGRLTGGGRYNKNQAKVALARELIKLVYVVWSKGEPYTQTPPPRPGSCGENRQTNSSRRKDKTTETTLRPDQPRHPMVRRRRQAVGQTDS
jgi:transposase